MVDFQVGKASANSTWASTASARRPPSGRAESKREACDDAEIATPAAQRPEEIRMPVFVRGDEAAVGKDDVRLDEVVDRQPERASHVPDAAAEREPAHAGRGDDPEGRCEPERLRGMVDLPEQCSSQHLGDARVWI